MTVVVEGKHSYFLGTQALLLDDNRDVASSWASQHIIANDAIKWVIGKYVEADNANYNGQLWSLADLQMSKPTIVHAPMNINHHPRKIVGTFVAAEMMYPKDEQAQEVKSHPFIETLGAFWRFYFPDEMEVVQAAFDSGECFLSMECVSATVSCVGEGGCGETFDYAGPNSETYCAHLQEGGIRQLNQPHFLAGALVVPPAQPGWGGAEVTELSRLVKEYATEAENLYNQISEEAPHLDPQKWEELMGELLLKAKGTTADDPRLKKVPAQAIGRRIARDSIKQNS